MLMACDTTATIVETIGAVVIVLAVLTPLFLIILAEILSDRKPR
jgi:hypothetical protein